MLCLLDRRLWMSPVACCFPPCPVADIQCLEPTPRGGNPSARAKHMVLRLSKQGSYQVLFRAHEASPRLANEVCDWKKAALIRLAGLTRTRPPNVSFGGHGALWGLSRGATPR